MIGLMHEAEPYGHLLINGNPISDETLSMLIAVPLKAVRIALRQLGELGVYSITDNKIIFSRRMVRDEMRATSLKVQGKMGGNPALKNQSLNNGKDNPTLIPEDKAHIPEAIFQSLDKKKEKDISPSSGPVGNQLTLVPTEPKNPAKEENQDFENWWKQYPRRVDKGSARKAYDRIIRTGKATVEQLMAGAMRYAAERQHEDPKYTKHATTWLNAEAWGNEAVPVLAAGGNQNRGSQSRADSAIEGMMSYFNERERQ